MIPIPATAAEAAATAIVLGAALFLAAVLGRGRRSPQSVWFGRFVVDGVLFSALAAGGLLMLRVVSEISGLVHVLTPFFVAMGCVRLTVGTLRRAPVHPLEWMVSAAFAAVASMDWLPAIVASLEDIRWHYGRGSIDLLQAMKLAAGLVVAVALVLATTRWLEGRLRNAVPAGQQHIVKVLVSLLRVGLMLGGGFIVLPLAGVDVTPLAALGGALGVGAGLAFRHWVASLVSGYILLSERSVREGDLVRIGPTEGRVTEITPRYTALRSGKGQTLIPNSLVAESRVENLTLSDRETMLTSQLRIDQNVPLDALQQQLKAAAEQVDGVLAAPAPAVHVARLHEGAVELALEFWTDQPERKTGIVSDVNLAVLRVLQSSGIRPAPVVRVARA